VLTLTIDRKLAAAIAVTRFGLGARSGEIDQAAGDPRGFLAAQISATGADPAGLRPATSAERMRDFVEFRADRSIGKQNGVLKSPAATAARKRLRDDLTEDFSARLQLAVSTSDGFRERWALFWINHFTVSGAKIAIAPFMGPFENEAMRPHVFGRFEDLLVASSTHTAMLHYLDQASSIGPNSSLAENLAQPYRHRGLNENLAREILELHTVGLKAGYTQADVTEFARAMTGWSVAADHASPDRSGLFAFHARAHEPGARMIMGRHYAEGAFDQARAVMTDLAASPHTANHVAEKLARHFVSDDPPRALVARLRQSYMTSGGDLSVVAHTLIASPEAWAPEAEKLKTPYEFLVSAWRATDATPQDLASASSVLASMGQKPYEPPSPKGWPDEARVWCAPDALVKRMDWSESFAASSGANRNPMQLASSALGARLTPLVAKTIASAETRTEGLSILLMSPEFQRR
jgi:uncharacterized protein (DUF1800 family)